MIRPAVTADCERIAQLWNPLIRETVIIFSSEERTADGFEAMIMDRRAQGFEFFVAEAGGEVLGFATYAQFRGGNGFARTMEHTVVLGPAARGRGLGRALMAAVEDHARRGGAVSIFAAVSADNPEGRAFHAAVGYSEVALLRSAGHKFGRALDLVLMQKFLDQAADTTPHAG